MLDSLVGFLRGPVWNVPVLTFIEQKSLIFEPGEDERNEEEYKKIHEEYKNLVDFMLGSYMEDIGITAAQFQESCGRGQGRALAKFQHRLFEQVWAADDFQIFKRMMTQKNIELQLQALELLQQRYGILPESLRPKVETKEESTEAQLMEQISMQVQAEHETHVSQLNEEEAEIEKTLAGSLEEHRRLAAEKQNQEALLIEHFKRVNITDTAALGLEEAAEPVTYTPDEEIEPEEVEKRAAFLRSQRDKLLQLKRAEREKQLEAAAPQARPKSARAARNALGRGAFKQDIDPKTLEIRRALAKKLMSEVVGHEDEAD